ncbi:MAG: hypothetical protein AB8D52_07405 [Gammaproteobacteria bacterium]
MTINKLTGYFQLTFTTLLFTLIAACSSTSKQVVVSGADYGDFPQNYQQTVKSYLTEISSQQSHDPSSARFLNTPDKFTYDQLGRDDQFGYRVCALIRTSDGRNTKSHFFLINNDQVIQHLQDLGLLSLSDDYCDVELLTASLSTNNEAEVSEVPEKTTTSNPGIKYLVCDIEGDDMFFAYNPKSQQLQEEQDGSVVSTLVMSESTDTFIVAEGEDTRVAINRVSGSMVYVKEGIKSKGNCELTRKQKF